MSSTNKTMSVLALIASLFFLALIVLQVVELRGYSSPPTAWPAASN